MTPPVETAGSGNEKASSFMCRLSAGTALKHAKTSFSKMCQPTNNKPVFSPAANSHLLFLMNLGANSNESCTGRASAKHGDDSMIAF